MSKVQFTSHKHESLVHNHEHPHIVHHLKGGNPGEVEHLVALHAHDHNHSATEHSHSAHQNPQREHGHEAHIHDHASPTMLGR
ncbi:MAG: hypothetical protein HYX99_03295 [Chloroflexi bacterium]|nr:hypothetical protein [Chloroflexota bacterium]